MTNLGSPVVSLLLRPICRHPCPDKSVIRSFCATDSNVALTTAAKAHSGIVVPAGMA